MLNNGLKRYRFEINVLKWELENNQKDKSLYQRYKGIDPLSTSKCFIKSDMRFKKKIAVSIFLKTLKKNRP